MTARKLDAGWLAAVAVALTTGSGLAADLYLPPVATEDTVHSHMFDIAFGVTATTDYVSRGYSQTDNGPALQGYGELSLGPVYAGIWASNVDFAGDKGTEIDVSGGIRHEVGIFSFDVGYVHYFYSPSSLGDDYGEIYGLVEAAVHDRLTLGGAVYYAPDYAGGGESGTYVEANASYDLPHDLSLSGAIGDQTVGSTDYLTWNAGLTWSPKDWLSFDVRYHDTDNCSDSTCDARVVGSISIDTSLSALKGM